MSRLRGGVSDALSTLRSNPRVLVESYVAGGLVCLTTIILEFLLSDVVPPLTLVTIPAVGCLCGYSLIFFRYEYNEDGTPSYSRPLRESGFLLARLMIPLFIGFYILLFGISALLFQLNSYIPVISDVVYSVLVVAFTIIGFIGSILILQVADATALSRRSVVLGTLLAISFTKSNPMEILFYVYIRFVVFGIGSAVLLISAVFLARSGQLLQFVGLLGFSFSIGNLFAAFATLHASHFGSRISTGEWLSVDD